MNKQLIIKNNELFGEVRFIKVNNKEYAVATDVAKALGYAKPNNAITTHCRSTLKQGIATKQGNMSEMILISEGDIYRLIVKSKLPQAEKFESWVFDEVLPQIRQTGGYIPISEEMTEAEIMAKALLISQRTIEKKDELLKIKTAELEEKNRFIGQISSANNSLLVRDVAHLVTKNNFKIGERRLWEKLREWGLIFKNSTKPMQRALEQGLFEVSEFTIQTNHGVSIKHTTRVTGKGQVYIIERLLKEGLTSVY